MTQDPATRSSRSRKPAVQLPENPDPLPADYKVPDQFVYLSERVAVPGGAPPVDGPPVVPLLVSSIEQWIDNPRTYRDDAKFQELVELVRLHGVIQNITVRPHPSKPGMYLLVAGERRWRAAGVLGLERIPSTVRELTDQQAYEIALAENVGQEDMSPVDEALAFQRMMNEHGRSVEEVAARIGKDAVYVGRRLTLCALEPRALDLVRGERLTLGAALELARVAREVQQRFLDDLTNPEQTKHFLPDEGAIGGEQLRGILRAYYLLRLRIVEAPFDTSDAELVPEVGACTTCPKNSAAQRALFDEETADASCLAPTCWKNKLDAFWKREQARAPEERPQLLEGKSAEQLFERYGTMKHTTPLLRLDEYFHDAPRKGARSGPQTFGQFLEKALRKKPDALVLVRHPQRDEVIRCIQRVQLPDLLRAAGHAQLAEQREQALSKPKVDPAVARKEAQRKATEQAEHEAIGYLGRYVELMLEACIDGERIPRSLQILLAHVAQMSWTRKHSQAAERRELGEVPPESSGWQTERKPAPLDPRLGGLTVKTLAGFLVELLCEQHVQAIGHNGHLVALYQLLEDPGALSPKVKFADLVKRQLEPRLNKLKQKQKSAAGSKPAKSGLSKAVKGAARSGAVGSAKAKPAKPATKKTKPAQKKSGDKGKKPAAPKIAAKKGRRS